MVRSIVPVDVQAIFLNTGGYKHCQHGEQHANKHADTQWRADATPVQQRVDDSVK